MRRLLASLASLGVLATVATAQPVLVDQGLTVDTVAVGLESPTQFVFLGPDDFLVTEKNSGRVQRVTGGSVVGTALDLAVNTDLDRGLLAIELHPDFDTNGWVYLYFTESSTGADTGVATEFTANKIVRYEFDGSVLTNPTPIFEYPTAPSVFHCGGVLQFGPDGKLYHVYGDQQRFGQLQNRAAGPAPDDTSALIRLNDDGTAPVDNPFAGQAGLANVYAYGMRNSFGLDFDPVSGLLWQTENGPVNYDEINRVVPGLNSGWNRIMGPEARTPGALPNLVLFPGATYLDPAFSFFVPQGITAIEFLRSTALGSEYENDLFSTEIVAGQIFRFDLNGARDALVLDDPFLGDLVADSVEEEASLLFGSGFEGVTDLETGPTDGALYVLNFRSGWIHRIRAKTLDLVTDDAQIETVCPPSGEVAVTGSYQAYGLAENLPLASVTTSFYLDVAEPANLLRSFVDTNVDDGDDIEHQFTFSWPDSLAHDVVMVVDALDDAGEEFEQNNVARVTEDCQAFVVSAPSRPVDRYGIRAIAPNPFNPRTTIDFEVPRRMSVRVEVFDVRGRLVRSLLDEVVDGGTRALTWNGTDDAGRAVASGAYFVRLRSNLGTRSRAITLLE